MRKIDEHQAQTIFESYSLDTSKKTMPLEELCDAFGLSIKDDGDVIFSILAEHLCYSDKPQPVSTKFAWYVDKEGCRILGNYAFAKQECLSTFQELYRKGYIRSKQPKESASKGGINVENN